MTAIVIITFNIYDQVFLLQAEAVKKFCLDEHRLIIVDNSTDAAAAASIKYHSERLGLQYIRTLSGTGDSSWSHAFAANTAIRMLAEEKYDYFLFLDHDNIPIKSFSVPGLLNGKKLGGLAQNKSTTYLWPGCFMWDNNQVNAHLIDFSPNAELQLDTGGQTHLLIEKYGREACLFIDEIICENPAYPGNQYNFYNLLCNSTFMHFINASNWNKIDDNIHRLNSLINIAREAINYGSKV